MVHLAIIDYGAGNLHSVRAGFERVMQGEGTITVTADASEVATASHVVLPGVGAFGDCVRALRACSGMIEALHTHAMAHRRPFLGICVGMQMLLQRGHEHGLHEGLGWFAGEVVPILPSGSSSPPEKAQTLRIPHMGWNELHLRQPHPLLHGIEEGAHAYFVHSFHARCANPSDMLATVDYGGEVVAAIGRENIVGTQFHPEKSHYCGAHMLANFLKME